MDGWAGRRAGVVRRKRGDAVWCLLVSSRLGGGEGGDRQAGREFYEGSGSMTRLGRMLRRGQLVGQVPVYVRGHARQSWPPLDRRCTSRTGDPNSASVAGPL